MMVVQERACREFAIAPHKVIRLPGIRVLKYVSCSSRCHVTVQGDRLLIMDADQPTIC